mmetsp:Transcript_14596/g.20704  ORF Transcript_14596/g.20704 Transcript_14596/m.20704 type:complete len:101 (+) Transcript_14596:22-324(+)
MQCGKLSRKQRGNRRAIHMHKKRVVSRPPSKHISMYTTVLDQQRRCGSVAAVRNASWSTRHDSIDRRGRSGTPYCTCGTQVDLGWGREGKERWRDRLKTG